MAANSLIDAQHRYFGAKFPSNDFAPKNATQTLVNSSIGAGDSFTSQYLGNPNTINIFFRSNATTTLTIYLASIDKDFFEQSTISVPSGTVYEGVVNVPGGSYIRVASSAAVTLKVNIQAAY